MECSNDGLTLWYDTPDAPVQGDSITVGVRPAAPGNAVNLRYRVDGGFVRTAAAALLTSGLSGARTRTRTRTPSPEPLAGPEYEYEYEHQMGRNLGAQYFRASLPAVPPGALVEVLPVLTCGGRQTPSPAGDPTWLSYRQRAPALENDAPAVAPGPLFTHRLEYLGTVSVHLGRPPEDLGVLPQGLRRTFYIVSGACVGPRLNATIRPVGADWMLIQRDGLAIPNVRTTWETPDGALLYGEYSGVFDLGEDGYENALRNQFPTRPVVQLAPRFVTSHPRYLWLNRRQCVGIGQVDMDRLFVQYDLHAVTGGEGPGSRKAPP
jgi:hypothetical protein